MKDEKMWIPDRFWEDWMLAVAGLKGEVEIIPETLKRWAQEVKKARKAQMEGEKKDG